MCAGNLGQATPAHTKTLHHHKELQNEYTQTQNKGYPGKD